MARCNDETQNTSQKISFRHLETNLGGEKSVFIFPSLWYKWTAAPCMERKGWEMLRYWEDVQAGVLGYIRESRGHSGATNLKEEFKSKKQAHGHQGRNVMVTES